MTRLALAGRLAERGTAVMRRGLAAAALAAALSSSAAPVRAQDQDAPAAAAAEPAPEALTVAVFAGRRTDFCYDLGYSDAITRLSRMAADRINASGMLGTRRLEIEILEGDREPEAATADIRAALAKPGLLGVVGLSRSQTSKDAFAVVGPEIEASGAPFISNIGLNSVIEPYPNVFSMRVSQDEEQIPALRSFMRDANFVRPAFVGRKGSVFSEALGDGLARRGANTVGPAMAADLRLELPGRGEPDPALVADTVARLKAAEVDVVFLNVGGRRSVPFMLEMIRIGYTPAVFLSGRIESLFGPGRLESYPGSIYQLTWGGALPNIQNERLRRLVDGLSGEGVVFGGARNDAASGWADGSCQENPDFIWSSPYAPGNLRAAARGAEYADMVALIAQAATTAPRGATMAALRAHVVDTVKSRFSAGRGAFEGRIANWSFRSDTRTATRTPSILERPPGAAEQRLASIQYVRNRGDSLRRVQTYYMDIDLIRIFRVDDNAGTFFAEMYLSLYDEGGAAIDKLDFSNAFIDPDTNKRSVEIFELHNGGASDTYPEHMKLYRISGRFMFQPGFEVYPFDTQRFSIDIKPLRSDDAMILQPPAPELRDRAYQTEGWSVLEQYVSYDEDFTPLVNARTGERSIAPYYKASFVWIMDRQATDYYLRVAVPLMVILAIAYFSIFISKEHFEAIVTIQVTALLSAVALYLAIPKVDSATATLSDKIFLLDYFAVFLMIVTSILRANRVVRRVFFLPRLFDVIHVVAVPLMVGVMGLYVYGLSRPSASVTPDLSTMSDEQRSSDLEATAARRQ